MPYKPPQQRTLPFAAGTALIHDARSASRARVAVALMAPPAAAPMGGSGSAEEKKKAFEMAKQVRLGCSRAAAAAAGSKRVRGLLLGSCG